MYYIQLGDLMKRIKILRKPKKRNKHIISLFLFIIIIYILFQTLDSIPLKIGNKKYVSILLEKTTYSKKESLLKLTKDYLKNIYQNPTKYLLQNQSKLIKEKKIKPVINLIKDDSPLIYIYNSHQTEEYSPSSFLEYSVNPTVTMVNYILENKFKEQNYSTIVEEASIKEILNKNAWKYSSSYKASRLLLEQRKIETPTLKYFIDVHRDSLKKDRTTVVINDKSYAKILFIVGLENSKYQNNLNFTTEIDNCLNEKYPALSKGIYKKSGAGVNGVYNQDFSPFVILVEMGGYENTTTEVLNSSLAFSECFLEVIKTYESKSNS